MTVTTSPEFTTLQSTERSALVGGVNHVAQSTQNLDRLVAFYRDTMEIPFVDESVPEMRHGFLLLGGTVGAVGSILHVFEVPADKATYGQPEEMFRRGRFDHIGIEAADERAFAIIRDRLIAAGACEPTVTIYDNWLLSIQVVDPDGTRLEVTCAWTGEVFSEADLIAGP